MNEEKSKEKRFCKKPSKRTIVTCSGIVAALCVGGISGYFLAGAFSPSGTDYSNINADGLQDDQETLYKDYIENKKDPLSYSPNDLVNIAIYKYSQEKYTSSDVRSSALAMGVNQKTYGRTIKNDGELFTESISHSAMVKAAKRFYETEEKVDIYNGEVVVGDKNVSGKYGTEETLTSQEYKDTWGKNMHSPVIYVISEKTTLDTSKVEKTDSGYLISLDLDPVYSVVNYVKQMVKMSNLSRSPEFENVHLEFTVDNELNLQEMNVTENYKVWYIIEAATSATLTETYHIYDSPNDVPNFDEIIFYEE